MSELIENELTEKIIGAEIEVHRYWGRGLVESIYKKSLAVGHEPAGASHEFQCAYAKEWNQETGSLILMQILHRASVPR